MNFDDRLKVIDESQIVDIDEEKHEKVKKYFENLLNENKFSKIILCFHIVLFIIIAIYIFVANISTDIVTAIFIPPLFIGLIIFTLLFMKKGNYKIDNQLIEKIENKQYKIYKYNADILKIYLTRSRARGTTYYLETENGYLFDITNDDYKYIEKQIEKNKMYFTDVYLVEEIIVATENLRFNSIPVVFVDKYF